MALLREVAALAPGSTLRDDVPAAARDVAEPAVRPGMEMAAKGARASGTPFISFFTPAEMHGAGARRRLPRRAARLGRRAGRALLRGPPRRPAPADQLRGAAGRDDVVFRWGRATPVARLLSGPRASSSLMSAQDARGPKDHDAPRSGAPPAKEHEPSSLWSFLFVAEENLSSCIEAIASKSQAMTMSGTGVPLFRHSILGNGTRVESDDTWSFRAAIALNRGREPMPLSCARSHEQERKCAEIVDRGGPPK